MSIVKRIRKKNVASVVGTGNSNAIIGICPDCTIGSSKVVISEFTALTVDPPTCFTTAQGVNLGTGGVAELTSEDQIYQGVYAFYYTNNQVTIQLILRLWVLIILVE